MKSLILIAAALVGCAQAAPAPTPAPDHKMAARADTQGTGILTTSSGTNNVSAFYCDSGVSSVSSSTGLPVCTPTLQVQDGAVIVSGLLETGITINDDLTGIDGGASTITLTSSQYANHVARFEGNPGFSDGGGDASLTFVLPAVQGGASGYDMIIDLSMVTMSGVGALGFEVGGSQIYHCSSLGIQQGMYTVASGESFEPPSVGLQVKP